MQKDYETMVSWAEVLKIPPSLLPVLLIFDSLSYLSIPATETLHLPVLYIYS